MVTAGAADKNAAPTSLSVSPAEDTYVYQEYPDQNRATSTKLTASNQDSLHTRSYLRFAVKGVPAGVSGLTAHLTFTSDRNQPALVELHRVASSAWSAATTTMKNAPAVGETVATARPAAKQKTLDFDLSRVVTADGDYSFALVAPLAGTVSAVYASEHGTDGPTLALNWSGDPAPGRPGPTAPNPSAPGLPSMSPVTPSASPTKPAPTTPAPTSSSNPAPPPSNPSGGTMFGATVWTGSGLSQAQALAQANARYGKLEVVRVFYPGLPPAWPGAAGTSGGPVVVSFKANPKDVLSGSLDSRLGSWFATAPKDRQVIWSYYHEPEDDIARGSFSAADYRSAWAHLRQLANKAGNPQLKSSLILMGWSLKSACGRNRKDYYPGSSVIDILGWDVYNLIYSKGQYSDTASIVAPVVAASKAEGKPWGIAELGAKLVPGDDGTRRAAWLTSMGAYSKANGALYVTYFDAPVGGEFRLLDAPSQAAWRSVIAS
ncbi:MAG TPA: DNRLRE domain-containing protein [Mycobacteriales bacterium]|nr:DNRLRE domain-containing protein [Mycobacteriales bacterium]